MSPADEKELTYLKRRLKELAEKSYSRGIYTYTPFLGLSGQQAFYAVEKEISYAGYGMEGGAPMCERKLIRFGSPEALGYDEPYPIARLEIAPVMPRFAQELTHRDFLGALMKLGIERGVLGDIFIKEKGAVIFCAENMARYIMDNLKQVKHTNVSCFASEKEEDVIKAEPKPLSLTVSSIRIDALTARIYNIPRSAARELFRAGKVFVNGRLMENADYQLKAEDAVTVRGYGKFLYYGVGGVSRKGKDRVEVGIFQ